MLAVMVSKTFENGNICVRIPLEVSKFHSFCGGKANNRLRSNSFQIFRIIWNVAFYIGLSPIKILSNESDSVRISKLTKRRKVTFIIVDMQAKNRFIVLIYIFRPSVDSCTSSHNSKC
jgi:hypothetical protein